MSAHSHSLRLLRRVDGSRINILIVEDNDSSRRLVVELLRSSGFSNLSIARDAEDAIDQMQRHAPDLLILDWVLPGMSGIELARTIRSAAASPDTRFADPSVPMIMLTSRHSTRDVTTARNAGIDEFVIKPFSTLSILKAVCSCLLRKRPFIVSAGYTGPDRRRPKKRESYTGLLRRAADIEAAAETNARRMYQESLSVELNGLRAYMQARGGMTRKMLDHMLSRIGHAEERAHQFRLKLIEQATHSLRDYMDHFGDAADPEIVDVHLDTLIQLNDASPADNLTGQTLVKQLKTLVTKRRAQRKLSA